MNVLLFIAYVFAFLLKGFGLVIM